MLTRIAIVTRARAPYLRALQEAFAGALPPEAQIYLIWPANEPSDFPDESVTPQAANIHLSLVNRGTDLGSYRKLPSLALWRELSTKKPDSLWVHELSPFALLAIFYAKFHGLPVVVSTEVGLTNAHFFPLSVRLWHELWSHLADGIIACCPAARQPMCREQRPVVDAFHAVDSRLFLPSLESRVSQPTTFVFVGQMIPRKGVDLLLAAAVLLKQRGMAFRLRLIGRDRDGWALQCIQRLGLEAQVEQAGFLSGSALQEAITSADVFVLPTRQDTYAAVVHEAACLGMPLLISQHAGACAALVVDGVTGFAIDPADTPSFADRMAALCSPQLRASMAKASRARGDELSAHRRGPAIAHWLGEIFDA